MAQISSSTTEASSSSSSSAVVHDGSTIIERTIKKTIDGIQALLSPVNSMTPEEEMEEKMAVIKISEATQKHFNLQTKILQDAPRDPDKLRQILKDKQEEYEKAEDSEVIEDLVTEIGMLKYVLFLVNRNSSYSS